MSSVYTRAVEIHGLGLSMRMMIERVPQGARVLDVGCASGYLAEPLREHRGCPYVDGVELDPADAALARRSYRNVVVGSAEEAATYARLAGPYDAVLLGDVLEHLRDPAAVLRHVRALLAPDGVVVSSIPNVAHYSIRAQLLQGHFDYADTGILDRTHLRFFTRSTLLALFTDNGYRVTACDPALKPPVAMPSLATRWLPTALVQSVARMRDEIFAFQYITVAVPARPLDRAEAEAQPVSA